MMDSPSRFIRLLFAIAFVRIVTVDVTYSRLGEEENGLKLLKKAWAALYPRKTFCLN